MILTAFHGFCMALADSVPGVSGGTLASIPFIAAAERTALKKFRSAPFALLGMAVVVGLTLLRGSSRAGKRQPSRRSRRSRCFISSSPARSPSRRWCCWASWARPFCSSQACICPPFRLSAASCTWSFPCCRGSSRWASACSAGVALSIHAIRTALHKYRSEVVWLILGADARFTLRHRVWSGQPDRTASADEPCDL